MVLNVASRKDTGHRSLGGKALEAALGHDVAVFKCQLALEDVGVRGVANGDEAAFEFHIFEAAVFGAFQAHTGHTRGIAQHLFQGLEGFEHDFACGHLVHQLVDQNGFGFEFVTAVNQIHLAGDVGEVKRFFDGGVTAAHHTAQPSQVAQPLTPRPMKAVSDGRPRYLAEAPVAMIRLSQV